MKLSIIVPVYRNSKYLIKYFDRLSRVTTKNYEIVFVIDTNLENVLEIIERRVANISGSHKIIYNTKRTGRSNAVNIGIENASGDYIIVQSLKNKFQEDYIDILLAEAASKNSDIIEFKLHIADPIKLRPSLRKNFVKPVNINEKKEVIAYSYPFTGNKIFKAEVVKRAIKLPSISKTINCRLSIELLYKIFISAKTYSTIAVAPIKSYLVVENNFNPMDIEREWDLLLKVPLYKDYLQELRYARYFNDLFIMTGFIKTLKNKVISKKFKEKFGDLYTKDNDLFLVNKYYLSDNNETKIMKEFRNKNSEKAYKEL